MPTPHPGSQALDDSPEATARPSNRHVRWLSDDVPALEATESEQRTLRRTVLLGVAILLALVLGVSGGARCVAVTAAETALEAR